MSTPLDDIKALLEAQGRVLSRARYEYLSKEAERKHREATLIKGAEGKSVAEKTLNAQATDDWLVFHRDLAKLEAIYEFERLKMELLRLEFQAQYLSLKQDQNQIERGIGDG